MSPWGGDIPTLAKPHRARISGASSAISLPVVEWNWTLDESYNVTSGAKSLGVVSALSVEGLSPR